jgi:Ca2+-binding RTX toxin-like protein
VTTGSGGGDGDDVLSGDHDDERLFGGTGMDTLDRGEGNDALFGEGGPDRLLGRGPSRSTAA